MALQVTTARTAGERELSAALCRMGNALIVTGYVISGDSRREVETDALVVTPHGVFTIEQKDTRGTGVLDVPVNGPPTLNGVALTKTANARAQARRQAQALASQMREAPALQLGFVVPVLCVSGGVTMATEESGEVLLATPRTIAQRLRAASNRTPLPAPEVAGALRRLRLPPLPLKDLTSIGFSA